MTKKILILTNERDVTADFIVKKLKNSETEFYRLNTDQLGKTLQLTFNISEGIHNLIDKATGESIDLRSFASVYFRRPEIRPNIEGLSRGEENFVRTELYYTIEGLYKILDNAFWLNKVQAIRNAENKIYQLLLAKKIGFKIPDSLITNQVDDALNFYRNQQQECIIKPIKTGLVTADGDDEAIIFTSKVEITEENAQRIKTCPVYLQKLIKKKGDVRVTVVGNKLFAALIHSQDFEQSKTDWRRADHPLPHSQIVLPHFIESMCLELTNELSLNFAAIDFILDENDDFIFLEINPNGQWAWIERRLGYDISGEITKLLIQNTYPNDNKVSFLLLAKERLNSIREFFWPLLERSAAKNKVKENIELKIADESLEIAFQQKIKILEAEEDRRKGIESKATLFISTLSVASSLVVTASTLILNNNFDSNRLLIKTSVAISFILALYTVTTIWYAVKALERGTYSVLSINDLNQIGNKNEYLRKLIQRFIRIKLDNQDIINSKVNNVTMAQEYYKRAIVIICIYAFFILLFCLFK